MSVRVIEAKDATGEERYTYVASPIGPLLVARAAAAVTAVRFAREGSPAAPDESWLRDDTAFDDVAAQLHAYFDGRSTAFDLTLSPRGTPFQLSVWLELLNVPHGSTRTYSEIAALIGRPAAVRAVGAANGANPIPVIVPCHRIIGRGGSLTGFGGGLLAKRFLLDLESGVRPLV